MEQKVAIVTDSVACLLPEQIEAYGIFVVPLSVIIGDQVYHDGVNITPGAVYALQQKSKILPTTSAATPGELLKIYRRASEQAGSILHVCFTPRLSMAYDAALKAKDMAKTELPGVEIEIFDTGTAAGAQGFLAMAAARVAKAGGTLDEALKAVRELGAKVHLYVTVDTLHFLAKGGRIPRIAAWAGSILAIKPILELARGDVIPIERVRTKPRATHRMVEIMHERVGDRPVHVSIMHAGVPREAEDLKSQLEEQFDCVEIFITEFSPVMGVHTGPGLLGLAFYCDE